MFKIAEKTRLSKRSLALQALDKEYAAAGSFFHAVRLWSFAGLLSCTYSLSILGSFCRVPFIHNTGFLS